jgi:hypothetical protein
MSSFVERLVARGAGLGEAPGFTALKPRPLSQFESPAASANGLEGDETGPLPGSEASIAVMPKDDLSATATSSDPRTTRRPISPTADAVGTPGAIRRASVERAEVGETVPARRIRTTAMNSDAVPDAVPPAVIVPSETVPLQGEAVAPPKRLDAVSWRPPAAPHADSAPVEEGLSPAVRPVPSATTRVSQPAETPPQPPVAESRRAAQATAEDDPMPPVTVTVGRIDVHFIQPATAPAAPPQMPRTRGFETYARARRGQPR